MAGIVVVAICFALWKFVFSTSDYTFHRVDLDRYVQNCKGTDMLTDGASVYVDMSDGMNSAYASAESKTLLQAIINKMAANDAIKFYGLADLQITPIDMSHTQLYNYMLDAKSYNKQKAPIEQTLGTIVSKRQPALLMTDFEEYNGAVIVKAAFAKKYFIEWISSGYNITFYKWPFVENGKNKFMFLAVFDDNANRMNILVDTAIKMTGSHIASYVLGGKNFNYPMSTLYVSLKEGGNYHNDEGKDVVTNVLSNGGTEDYVSYTTPVASATGKSGEFAPLDNLYGTFAEYYPIGVEWTDAIKNAALMKEEGVKPENMYTHLFSKLCINFEAQDGYTIDAIEVRTFDYQPVMRSVAAGDSIVNEDAREVSMFLKADLEKTGELPAGWNEIVVDFDSQFKGTFMGGVHSGNLIRANIVISQCSIDLDKVNEFFSWPDNPSLVNSIKETLAAHSCIPQGRVLYTYYIKNIAE